MSGVCWRWERHVIDNPAVHNKTVRDTQDYIQHEDRVQADNTDNECNAVTKENHICKTPALIHSDDLERVFKGKKHRVKVKKFFRQEKLKPDRIGAGARGFKDDGKRVHFGASTSGTKKQTSRKCGGTYKDSLRGLQPLRFYIELLVAVPACGLVRHIRSVVDKASSYRITSFYPLVPKGRGQHGSGCREPAMDRRKNKATIWSEQHGSGW